MHGGVLTAEFVFAFVFCLLKQFKQTWKCWISNADVQSVICPFSVGCALQVLKANFIQSHFLNLIDLSSFKPAGPLGGFEGLKIVVAPRSWLWTSKNKKTKKIKIILKNRFWELYLRMVFNYFHQNTIYLCII